MQANIRRLLRKHGVGSWFFIYLLKKNENLLSVKEFLEVAGASVNDDKRQSGTESGLSRAVSLPNPNSAATQPEQLNSNPILNFTPI